MLDRYRAQFCRESARDTLKNEGIASVLMGKLHAIPNNEKRLPEQFRESLIVCNLTDYLFSAVATSTAQATVQPTIGLLPIPRNPIISTCAGTDDKLRAEQIHLFCRGAKEEKPKGLN